MKKFAGWTVATEGLEKVPSKPYVCIIASRFRWNEPLTFAWFMVIYLWKLQCRVCAEPPKHDRHWLIHSCNANLVQVRLGQQGQLVLGPWSWSIDAYRGICTTQAQEQVIDRRHVLAVPYPPSRRMERGDFPVRYKETP